MAVAQAIYDIVMLIAANFILPENEDHLSIQAASATHTQKQQQQHTQTATKTTATTKYQPTNTQKLSKRNLFGTKTIIETIRMLYFK